MMETGVTSVRVFKQMSLRMGGGSKSDECDQQSSNRS